MTNLNPIDYFHHKTDLDTLQRVVSNTQSKVEQLHRQIADIQSYIKNTNAKVAVEEHEMSMSGSLSRATLTFDELTQLKRTMDDKEAELMALNEELAFQSQALTVQQNDVQNKKHLLKNIRERIADALANQAAQEITELASEPLTNLIHAMVASEGKHPNKELFLAKLGIKIRDALCQSNPAWLPNLPEAKQHVEGQLHQLYLSEAQES